MVHRLCAHLLDGSVELRNQIVGFVGGSASRAFDLDQHPDVDEVVKIAFAEQKAPSKAAGQKFRGRLANERTFAGARLQDAQHDQAFHSLPDCRAPDLKSDRQLFLGGNEIARFPELFS